MTKEQQAEQAQPQVNAAGDDVMVGVSSAVSLPVSSEIASEISPAVSLEVSPVVSPEVSPIAAEVVAPTTVMTPEAARPKAQPRRN